MMVRFAETGAWQLVLLAGKIAASWLWLRHRRLGRRLQIPGLGSVVEDADLGWYISALMPTPVLGGAPRRIIVDGYDDDDAQDDFHATIRTFLTLERSALTAAAPSIFAYYRDVMDDLVAAGDHDLYVEIEGPHVVLDHVRFGDEPTVSRDPYGDRHVYVSLECECDWEPEHGLQIVFRAVRRSSDQLGGLCQLRPRRHRLLPLVTVADRTSRDSRDPEPSSTRQCRIARSSA